MNCRRFAPWLAGGTGALLVLAIGSLWSTRPDPRRPEVLALLSKLEAECHPESATNNYAWSSNAPPTEKHRRLILERLHELRHAAAPEVARRLEQPRNDEFGEMLIVVGAALGNRAMIVPAAKLMAYSENPAVRLSAARELRMLRDPRTLEWFDYAAHTDDRRVRNEGCGRVPEFFYPVRTTAILALREMGIEFKTAEQRRLEKKKSELDRIQAIVARELDAQRRRKASPPPPPLAPAGKNRQ